MDPRDASRKHARSDDEHDSDDRHRHKRVSESGAQTSRRSQEDDTGGEDVVGRRYQTDIAVGEDAGGGESAEDSFVFSPTLYDLLVTQALLSTYDLPPFSDRQYWTSARRRRYAGNGSWQSHWDPLRRHSYYISPTGDPQWHIPEFFQSRPGHLPPGWSIGYDREVPDRVYYTSPGGIDHGTIPWTPVPFGGTSQGWCQTKVRSDYMPQEDRHLDVVAGETIRVTQKDALPGYRRAMKLQGHGDLEWFWMSSTNLEDAEQAEDTLPNTRGPPTTASPYYEVQRGYVLDELSAKFVQVEAKHDLNSLSPPFPPPDSASRPFNHQPWTDAWESDQNLAPTKAAVKSLRAHLITKIEAANEEGTVDCSICYEEADVGSYVAGLPCGHWYHHACIWEWLTDNGTCPHCRREY